jgi:hypothetical protein
MNTFGFSMSEPNYPPNYYVAGDNVSDDSVLWDWLITDNFERSKEVGMLDVLAPEGYIFTLDGLVPVSECTEEEVKSAEDEDSNFWVDASVRIPYRSEDKANLLLEGGVMRDVSHAEFYSLRIPEDRVLYFTID